jgi:hypothetical protein
MDKEEYLRLRQQVETTYREKLAALEADRRKKLTALDVVWSMTRQETEGGQASGNAPGRGTGTLTAAIRSVLLLTEGEFDINVIRRLIEEHRPEIPTPINPTSISGTLKKLAAAGVVQLTVPGSGKRASRYRAVIATPIEDSVEMAAPIEEAERNETIGP